MKTAILYGLALAGVLAGPAIAAPTWSGPYVGVDAGAAWGTSKASSSVACPLGGLVCAPGQWADNGALIGAVAGGSHSSSVSTVGLMGGYNWRANNLIFGLEADVNTLPLKVTNGGSAVTLNPGLGGSTFKASATIKSNAIATAQGRVGYLVSPNLLVYAAGGVAMTSLSVSNAFSDNFICCVGATGSSSVPSASARTRFGLALGGGAEWSLSQAWRARLDYQYVRFGSVSTNGGITYPFVGGNTVFNPFASSADLRAQTVRAGLVFGF